MDEDCVSIYRETGKLTKEKVLLAQGAMSSRLGPGGVSMKVELETDLWPPTISKGKNGEAAVDEDSVMKRRFVVMTKKGTHLGVIAKHVNMAVWGLYFQNDVPTGASCFLRPVVIAFAPGAWLYFGELAEGEDWPDGLDEIVQFGGEDEQA